MYVICNGHSPTDASARSGVTVMYRPWPLTKGSGFIPVLVSVCLPGIISASSKGVKHVKGYKPNPHTVQSDTTRCGVSRVGHAAKRPRLYRSDTDFTFTGSNLSRLPLDNNNVAIVKKRKKTKKRKKRKIWGEGCFGERPNPKITTSLFDFLANGSAALFA